MAIDAETTDAQGVVLAADTPRCYAGVQLLLNDLRECRLPLGVTFYICERYERYERYRQFAQMQQGACLVTLLCMRHGILCSQTMSQAVTAVIQKPSLTQ